MDAKKIPGVVAQQGGLVNINSGANQKIQNLGETVWDIFAEPTQTKPTTQKVTNNYQYQYQIPQYGQPQITPVNQGPSYQVYPKTQYYGQNQINIMPSNQYQYQYNDNIMPKMQMGGYYYK